METYTEGKDQKEKVTNINENLLHSFCNRTAITMFQMVENQVI